MLFWRSFQLHVIGGQSNAHGSYGNGLHYPADEQGIDSKIPFFYSAPGYGSSDGQWVDMGPQSGMYQTTHFGPEVAFARALWRFGHRPAIFKFTRPCSSLYHDWKMPGEEGMYDALCRDLLAAIQLLRKKRGRCQPASIVWIQGESDAETEELAMRYEALQLTLVRHMRKLLRKPKLPVILGVNEEHPWVLKRPMIVSAQKRIVSSHDWMAHCSMDRLEKEADSHLTPQGLVQHGERLFEAYRIASQSFVADRKAA